MRESEERRVDQTERPMHRLQRELDGLSRYILRVRQEVAAIDRPAPQNDDFASMGDQMVAVVKATESATNTIMEAMESNGEAIALLREKSTTPTNSPSWIKFPTMATTSSRPARFRT